MSLEIKDANGNPLAITPTQLTQLQTDLGMGTAALSDVSAFATATQGTKADQAVVVDPTTGLILSAAQRNAVGSSAFYVPGLINWNYQNTRQITGAYLGALMGLTRSRILIAMDSNGAGTGSLNTDTVNARSKSWGVQLATAIKLLGGNAYSSWAIGSGIAGTTLANYLAYDPRVVFGSAATLSSTIPSCGGQSWGTGADSTNGYFEVTPVFPFDTVDVLHGTASLLGIFQMFDQNLVQAGSDTNTSGSNGVTMHTFTFPANSTKARLKSTGTNVRIAGMGFRNAAAPGMEIINMSISGGSTAFFATVANDASGNGWMNHNASMPILMTSATKNVFIMSGGANDILGGATLAQVQGYTRTRINLLQALTNVPDIIGLGYPPAAPSAYTLAERQALNEALRSVFVDEFNLPFIDPLLALPPHLDMEAIGMGASDGKHLQAAGQARYVDLIIAGMRYSSALIA